MSRTLAVEYPDRLPDSLHMSSSEFEREAVFTECAVGVHYDDAADMVRAAGCCDVRPVFPALPQSLSDLLDIGEAAVIHTALSEGITTVAIDELKGRRVAQLHGLRGTGLLGMLVTLYQQGVVPSIEQAIQRIQNKGIFLGERLIQEVIAATQTKG
jgi:predicted nucleic acid-binding protein